MTLPLQQITHTVFGGGNWADPRTALVRRSHSPDEGGWQQRAPVESPSLANMDFVDRAIGKRRGSEALEDLSGAFVASEGLLGIVSWTVPGSSTEVHVAVGVKSMYTDQSGTWVQLNDSASSAYSHAADVSKFSATEVAGHLIIGLDGANKIQVYRSGADLDDELDNGNTWNDTFGGGTSSITGTWGTGYHIVFSLHERLCFSKGDAVLEYTDGQEPWDRAGGGFRLARGNIIGALAFTPSGGNELNPVAFLSTTAGPQFLTGFDLTDAIKEVHATWQALNHRCLVAVNNWIVAMTREGNFRAINVAADIDLGRRLKAFDGTGPMDTFTATNGDHTTKPFGYYDEVKQQAVFYYPDASNSVNTHAVVLDFALGEPVPGEALQSYEQHVRLLWWSVNEPSTNPWFVAAYQRRGATVGVLADGNTYTLHTGNNDLDTVPIIEHWEVPDFDPAPGRAVKFRDIFGSFDNKGNWNLSVRRFLDFDEAATGSDFTWKMVGGNTNTFPLMFPWTWDDGGVVRHREYNELVGEAIRFRMFNQGTGETWTIRTLGLIYQIGRRAA